MEDSRTLETSLVAAFVLLTLGQREAHLHELRERLRECEIVPTTDGLDRALRRLETNGFLDSEWQAGGTGPDQPVYALTAAGRRELDRMATAIAALGDRVDGFLHEYARVSEN